MVMSEKNRDISMMVDILFILIWVESLDNSVSCVLLSVSFGILWICFWMNMMFIEIMVFKKKFVSVLIMLIVDFEIKNIWIMVFCVVFIFCKMVMLFFLFFINIIRLEMILKIVIKMIKVRMMNIMFFLICNIF